MWTRLRERGLTQLTLKSELLRLWPSMVDIAAAIPIITGVEAPGSNMVLMTV